jgi:hypothetical protein
MSQVTRTFVTILGLFALPAWGYAADAPPTPPAAQPDPGPPASLSINTGRATPDVIVLKGSESRQQLVVMGNYADGQVRDLTRQVTFTLEPAGVLAIDSTGVVEPRGNGAATIKATLDGTNLTVSLPMRVESFEHDPAINFGNQIVPILTKHGCNGGGCHGAANGQNGFKLSLLGFEPGEDHEHLVKESRGRRLSFAAPDQSLLLRKGAGTIPHGGGTRLDAGSPAYKLMRRWIADGAPFGNPEAAKVAKVEVFPAERLMGRRTEQQMIVTATYTDGTQEDVTAMAVYEANVPEMATISKRGLVTTAEEAGDVAVMIRYQSQVAVYRATIPLGAPVQNLPPQRGFIDELVFKKLQLLGLPPSNVTDDATFLRRVTVDIGGRLPTGAEAEAFLKDQDPAKRDKWIDKLLAGSDYADNFANKWAALLRNKRSEEQPDLSKPGTYAFFGWIRQAIQENRPYDQFVRGVLTAAGEASENPPVLWYRSVKDVNSQVEDTAQLFLGQRIQCAKCHHHPFEKWSQADYYRFSAFFTQLGKKPGVSKAEERVFHKAGAAIATHPKTGEKLAPSGLGGKPLEIAPSEDPRLQLVDWMTSPENPFFARSLVNRYWKHFFGRGLVDPEDDMRATNPATNPALLDALTKHFIEHGYDMKDIVRTICRSTVYQLSSEPNQYNGDDRQNFSRYYPRRLTAEVLLDSIDAMTGSATKFAGMPVGARAVQLPDGDFPSYFLTVFGRPKGESACECERGNDANLAQGLHLINSTEIFQKLSDGAGRAANLSKDQSHQIPEKIRELYMTAFGRAPTDQELAFVQKYLEQKSANLQQAYEDVVWSLVNSKEFLFNH